MDAFEPALLSYYLQVEFDKAAREHHRFPGVYSVPRDADPLGALPKGPLLCHLAYHHPHRHISHITIPIATLILMAGGASWRWVVGVVARDDRARRTLHTTLALAANSRHCSPHALAAHCTRTRTCIALR